MQNSQRNNSRSLQSRFHKILRRKVFLSNEVKKALLIAYYEAQANQTCVNLDLLLYGLLSQKKSLACRLFIFVISQYRNNINLSSKFFIEKLQKFNEENAKEKRLKELSLDFLNENKKRPWLMPEVKQTIRASINSALQLQSKEKVVILTTKNIFFDLLNNESIRNSLRHLVN